MARNPKAGEVIDRLAGHFLLSKTCSKQLERLLLQTASDGTAELEVVQVSLVELAQTQPVLVEQVVRSPLVLLKHFDRALLVSQHYMLSKHPRRGEMSLKAGARCRVHGIPGARLCSEARGGAGRSTTTMASAMISPSVGGLRACMANRLVCVSGTITKLGSPHLVEYKQQYECNRCHSRFDVLIDVHAGGHVQLPEVCPNDRGGGRRRKQRRGEFPLQGSQGSFSSSQEPSGCQGTNFVLCEENRYHKDCQEIRLQERGVGGGSGPSVGEGGRAPKSITVRLEDDLVDSFRPGQDVLVTGIAIQHWRRTGKVDQPCEVELLIDAVHVVGLSTDGGASTEPETRDALPPSSSFRAAALALGEAPGPSTTLAEASGGSATAAWVSRFWAGRAGKPLSGRDLIVSSLAPQVHGMHSAKLAVMLVLCGGVAITGGVGGGGHGARGGEDDRGGTKKGHSVRGECHLLLAGDPGTGKSQLMRCAAKLSARSIVTNGRGSTSAGLTATAVVTRGEKGTGGPGKRLGKRGEWALEAGALVLADGGVCCIDEFETMRESDRAAIHEAMEQQTLSIAKAGLVTKLRAQTAIIASTNIKQQKPGRKELFDPFTTGFDESMVKISAPLLSRFDLVLVVRDLSIKEWDSVIADHVLDQHCGGGGGNAGDLWPQHKLKEYVAHVRTLEPSMTDQAEEILKLYYQRQRQLAAQEPSGRPSARTTLRMLESLVRLSQAHARLMARDVVVAQDAVAVVSLMEASMKTSLVLGVQNVTQSVAPADPDAEAAKTEGMLLRALGLGGDDDEVGGGPRGEAAEDDFEAEEEEEEEGDGNEVPEALERKAIWGDNWSVWNKDNTRVVSSQ